VAEFDLIYGKGISHTSEVLDFAVALDLIQKSGSWFSYQGERLGQGKENARKALDSNPALAREIEDKIRAMSAETSDMMAEGMEDDIEGDDDFDIQLLKDDDLGIDD
jgi:recombination protein RecA